MSAGENVKKALKLKVQKWALSNSLGAQKRMHYEIDRLSARSVTCERQLEETSQQHVNTTVTRNSSCFRQDLKLKKVLIGAAEGLHTNRSTYVSVLHEITEPHLIELIRAHKPASVNKQIRPSFRLSLHLIRPLTRWRLFNKRVIWSADTSHP